MDPASIAETVACQRRFFASHATLDLEFRIAALLRLERAIRAHEGRLCAAMQQDFRKCAFEAYATEIGLVLEELQLHRKRLKRWARPERVPGSLVNFPSSNRILREPFGIALIIAPWNYPFQLLINPLVGALSAGNCAILKPADYTSHTGAAMAELIGETFDPGHVTTIRGGRDTIQALLEERFDTIFFTGSPALGKVVMAKAARHLTPVTLELGGKSPCIVDADANLAVAARRIAWGKFINAGQTCVAPDHLFVHRAVQEPFLEQLKQVITAMYGDHPEHSPDFARIINDEQLARLQGLLGRGQIVLGGQVDPATRYIAPTVITGICPGDPIMQEEIFGPLLPVLTFDRIEEVLGHLQAQPKPLALYYFSENRRAQDQVLAGTASGGACINDTVAHLANPHLPFGGVGGSGMGGYHGWYSFDTFSHRRALLRKPTWLDIPLRYPPYASKLALVKRILG